MQSSLLAAVVAVVLAGCGGSSQAESDAFNEDFSSLEEKIGDYRRAVRTGRDELRPCVDSVDTARAAECFERAMGPVETASIYVSHQARKVWWQLKESEPLCADSLDALVGRIEASRQVYPEVASDIRRGREGRLTRFVHLHQQAVNAVIAVQRDCPA